MRNAEFTLLIIYKITIMKKLSLLFALALFFVCGTALNSNASEILEITEQEYASIEISNKIEFQQNSNFSVVPAILAFAAELVDCTVTATISCGDVEIPVTATGDDCASAGAGIDELKDLMGCD